MNLYNTLENSLKNKSKSWKSEKKKKSLQVMMITKLKLMMEAVKCIVNGPLTHSYRFMEFFHYRAESKCCSGKKNYSRVLKILQVFLQSEMTYFERAGNVMVFYQCELKSFKLNLYTVALMALFRVRIINLLDITTLETSFFPSGISYFSSSVNTFLQSSLQQLNSECL